MMLGTRPVNPNQLANSKPSNQAGPRRRLEPMPGAGRACPAAAPVPGGSRRGGTRQTGCRVRGPSSATPGNPPASSESSARAIPQRPPAGAGCFRSGGTC